jgi:hypothetical protein
MLEYFRQVSFRCIHWLGGVVERHVVGLVEYFEDACAVLVKGGEVEDLKEERHHVLAHDGGVETELDSRVGEQLGQEVVEVWAVVVVVHLDLAVFVALETTVGLQFG